MLKNKKITSVLLASFLILGAMPVQAKESELLNIEKSYELAGAEEPVLGESVTVHEPEAIKTYEISEITEVSEEVVFEDISTLSIEEYSSNMVTSGLKAAASGKGRVTLTWNTVAGADGYLVYGQKSGKYGYVGMTTQGTTFNDTNALSSDYNYYWVFPYAKDSTGNMTVGSCLTYKYAKGICAAVTNLKSSSVANGAQLTWSASNGAEGYLVYGIRPGYSYGYLGMTTSATTYIDYYASKNNYTYYWVYPYFKDTAGNMIVGLAPSYTYGKAVGQSSSATIANKVYKVEEYTLSESINWINALRIQEGNGRLVARNDLLESAAMIRAKELATSFSHTRPNGTSCFTVVESSGYKYGAVGENIQCFSVDSGANMSLIAEYAFVNWYYSAGHYANMVSSSFNEVGVGLYVSGSMVYIVQMFGYGY